MSEDRGGFVIDKVIHERARLLILTYLASQTKDRVLFNELKEGLGLTGGNLSVQLRNLEAAGYVRIHKRIKGNKPETSVALTLAGYEALRSYVDQMERIIRSVRESRADLHPEEGSS
ncbi:MAG: transcriptional regulator [Firmicutes bacterium]|nr:transcriptional regulator [Bacillota bacterium]MDH7495614.1 transcriptional regulator [Bacillota bacterium]